MSRIIRLLTILSAASISIAGLGFFKTYIAYVLMGARPDHLVCASVCLVAFAVYSLDKIADLEKDGINAPQRAATLRERAKLVVILAAAAYLLALVLMVRHSPEAVIFLLVPALAIALYSRIKPVPLAKNLWVASAWTSATVLAPAVAGSVSSGVGAVAFFVFGKTFIDTVLYDLRDVIGDRRNGIRTVPVILGARKTTALLLGANSLLIPAVAMMPPEARPLAAALILYGFAYILYFRERADGWKLDLLVEGEWALAAVGLWLVWMVA